MIKAVIIFLAVCGILTGCSQKVGHMLVKLIESNTKLTVAYKHDLASDIIFAGIRTGVIDLYVDYTGTIYGSFLKYSDTRNPEEVHEISARELSDRYNLQMLEPLGFNNTFCLAVRADTAENYNLRTFSDLAEVSSGFIFGGSAELLVRNDGLPNLKRLYSMTFKEELIVDGADRYEAIKADEIQVTEAFATDGHLLKHDLVLLEDDKSFFPPYEGVIVVRNQTLEKHPELVEVLDKLTAILTDEAMRNLNYMVDVLDEDPKTVAENFLRENGLIH
jgi:osmoprotectant transport system permease protein